MPTCIYCPSAGPFGHEHYLSRALGTFRGLEALGDRLCVPCNGKVGRLDEAIVRNSPDALFRVLAGVRGRSEHDSVSPFYYGLFSRQTTRVLGKHPDYPFEVLWEIVPGTMETREARQVIVRRGDEYLAFPLPERQIADYLRHVIRQHGLEGAEIVAMFGGDKEGDEEHTAIMEAIKAVADEGKIVKVGKTEPGQVVSVSASLPITQPYARGIAKIAFHYLLAHLRVFTGHESAFDDAKRYIMTGEGFEGQIALRTDPIIGDLRRRAVLRHYTHLIQASVSFNEIIVRVQLFAGPAVSPPMWVVQVGRNPSRIYTGSFGHAFVLTGDAGDGHQGEMVELASVSRALLPAPR